MVSQPTFFFFRPKLVFSSDSVYSTDHEVNIQRYIILHVFRNNHHQKDHKKTTVLYLSTFFFSP